MKKRHGAEQIVAMLRQADAALGKGEKGWREVYIRVPSCFLHTAVQTLLG